MRPTKKACSPAFAQENQALFSRWSFTPIGLAYPFGVMKINSNCCARNGENLRYWKNKLKYLFLARNINCLPSIYLFDFLIKGKVRDEL